MDNMFKTLTRILNVIIVICLSMMAILVFTNVVLRYIFSTGIPWAEELSRYLFVWMVFIGSIMALYHKAHLSVDLLTNAVPPKIRKILLFLSNLIVLFLLWIILDGSWDMTLQNTKITAPATGLPMSFVYGVGIIMSTSMAAIVIFNMIKLFRSDENTSK